MFDDWTVAVGVGLLLSFQTNHAAPTKSKAPTTMPTTMPAMMPAGVPPWLGGASVTVALDVDCDDVKLVDAGVVEYAVDKIVLLAVLPTADVEGDVIDKALLMLK